MNLIAGRHVASRGPWAALIVAAVVAALVILVNAPAQAAPNIAVAWGWNHHGQLGQGTTTGPEECGPEKTACSTVPVAVSGLSGVKAAAGGEEDGLALLENGTVMAWGENFSGELGDGTLSASYVPVGVCEVGYSGPTPCPPEHYLKGVRAIAAGGGGFNVALLESGIVVDWGQIPFAKLGDGATTQSSVPVGICEVGYAGETPCTSEHYLKGVTAIAGGDRFGLALLGGTGGVAAWGENSNSAPASVFGDGTESSGGARNVPVAVCAVNEKAPCANNLSGVSAIAAGRGGTHALALVSGKVVAWGRNREGQLGDGTTEGTDAPVDVKGLSQVSAISTGKSFSLALMTNGAAKAWGANERGELGDGTNSGPERCSEVMTPCSKTPVAVSGLSGVSAIAAGGEDGMALLSSGSVLAWGSNEVGQLGDGTSTGPEPCPGIVTASCSTTPVAVLTHGAQAGIAAGNGFSLAFGPPPPAPTSLPELGRCKLVKKGTGTYKGSNCEHLAGGKGLYDWSPGAEKNKFEGSSATTVLSTAKLTVSCSTTILEGEYTGAKTAKATLVLKGCTNTASKVKCQSKPGSEGEIESSEPLEGELGFIKGGEKPQIGVDLKKSSKATSLATFFCANGPEKPEFQANLEGSVIGQITPLKKLSTEFKLAYKGTKGVQTPERFEGGLKDTLSITFLSPSPEKPPEESASLNAALVITNEEPLQVKTATYPS